MQERAEATNVKEAPAAVVPEHGPAKTGVEWLDRMVEQDFADCAFDATRGR